MKEKKYFSLPIEFTEIENINQFSNDNGLIPVSMKVMHNGLNLNKSIFSDEAIENAKESLKNRPILGYIKKVDGTDNVDFNGHDVDITFGEDGIKVTYLERPLGCVPESNEYSILEQDNKKYVTCKGYLWEEYLNDGYEILKNNPTKSVSMEIAVNDYEVNNDGTITIKDYTYLGVTVLGDSVNPAMVNCDMSIIGQFSTNFSEQFLEKIVDVNSKLFSTQYENLQQETESNEVETVEFQEESNSEPDSNETEETVQEFEVEEFESKEESESLDKQEFSLTANEKKTLLRQALPDETIENDDMKMKIYRWVMDFNDTHVMYSEEIYFYEGDGENSYKYYQSPYIITDGIATVNVNSKEEIVEVWITKSEKERLDAEKANFEVGLKTQLEEITTKYNEVVEELNKIHTAEKLEQLEDIYAEFDEQLSDVEGYSELKENAVNMDIEEVESQCVFMLGVKNRSKTSKTQKPKNKVFSVVGVNIEKNISDDKSDKKTKAIEKYGEAGKYLIKD